MLEIIEGVSHLDHLPRDKKDGIISLIMKEFGDRSSFFIKTIELPDELGTLTDGMYGPQSGDEPVTDDDVVWVQREPRPYLSRCVKRPMRPTRFITIIAGPHGDVECLLYTAFGGKVSPKEVNDPTLIDDLRPHSVEFWSTHAIAIGE